MVEEINEVICDHAETCTQRLVVCIHQKLHIVKKYYLIDYELEQCTDNWYCSVVEIDCKCIKK